MKVAVTVLELVFSLFLISHRSLAFCGFPEKHRNRRKSFATPS
jgi:hypothetical protein